MFRARLATLLLGFSFFFVSVNSFAAGVSCRDVFEIHPNKKLELELGIESGLLRDHESVQRGLLFFIKSASTNIEAHFRVMQNTTPSLIKSREPAEWPSQFYESAKAIIKLHATLDWAGRYYENLQGAVDSGIRGRWLRDFGEEAYRKKESEHKRLTEILNKDLMAFESHFDPSKKELFFKSWDLLIEKFKLDSDSDLGWQMHSDVAGKTTRGIHRALNPFLSYRKLFNSGLDQFASTDGLAGETRVSTPTGIVLLKDLKAGDEVLSLDRETGKIVTSIIESVDSWFGLLMPLQFIETGATFFVGNSARFYFKGKEFSEETSYGQLFSPIGMESSESATPKIRAFELEREEYPKYDINSEVYQLILEGDHLNFFGEGILMPSGNAPTDPSRVHHGWPIV